MKRYRNIILFFSVLSIFMACKPERLTLKDLFSEMSDRESLTFFPENALSHIQFSSYNRASVSPADSGWFANQDMSHFIRLEHNQGRREFVLLDTAGPGAIVRWWMTFYKAQNGIIRVYFDNEPEPRLTGSPDSLLSGSLVTGYPFSASVQKGAPPGEEGRDYDHNLYFPLLFDKHCKVTYECDSLKMLHNYEGQDVPGGYWWPDVFYNIAIRLFNPDTEVETFSVSSLAGIRPAAEESGKKLLEGVPDFSTKNAAEKLLIPGDSLVLDLKARRSSIQYLAVQLDPHISKQSLRSVVLKIRFDKYPTVWVPLGDFFGCGYTLSPHKTWMNRSDKEGLLESFWVMPFRENCEICLVNYGEETTRISLVTGLGQYKWKPESMYFGASWHEYYQIPSRDDNNSPFDLSIAEITGTGVYAGDQVTLYNNTYHWWGEGDEKIFVDGEEFPSVFGTGTEDYYGYSFAREEAFSHPFISQPVGKGNMNWGPTVNMRIRSLDAIPFRKSIKAQMELWHWAKVGVNYALTAYFYMKPPFSRWDTPDVQSVKNSVAASREDFEKSLKPNKGN